MTSKLSWNAADGKDADMRLPVTCDSAPGESLSSYIDRIADLNNLKPDELCPVHGPDSHTDLDVLARAVGLEHDALEALTWRRYPSSVIGPRGSSGWLLSKQRWWCSSCVDTSGVWQRTWELACLPVCFHCHRTLSAGNTQPQDLSPNQREVFHRLLQRVERSPDHRPTAAWLARLLRVTRLMAVTCDPTWPTTLTAENARALQAWSKNPPDTPNGLAELLPFTTRLIGSKREPYFVAQGWRRLEHRPHDIPHTLLPKRPIRNWPWAETPRRWNDFDDLSRTRVKRLTTALQDLDVDTIPGLIPSQPNEFLPPAQQWPEAQDLALAIHMLARPRKHHQPGWFTQAVHHLHLVNATRTPLLQALELRGFITTHDADRVEDAIERLRQIPAVDYRARRETLAQITRLRRLPAIQQPANLLGGWVWVYLTRGRITETSPNWAINDAPLPTQRVLELHITLTLDERARLADYAAELWDATSGADLQTSYQKMTVEGSEHATYRR